MRGWGLLLVKADVLSQVVQGIFGGKLEEVLGWEGRDETSRESPNDGRSKKG